MSPAPMARLTIRRGARAAPAQMTDCISVRSATFPRRPTRQPSRNGDKLRKAAFGVLYPIIDWIKRTPEGIWAPFLALKLLQPLAPIPLFGASVYRCVLRGSLAALRANVAKSGGNAIWFRAAVGLRPHCTARFARGAQIARRAASGSPTTTTTPRGPRAQWAFLSRERSSWRSTTWAISFFTLESPVALMWPVSYALR